MTFYLTYRPRRLNELDSEIVRESLTKIIKSQNIPHAFLFTGPKGTGKTSSARVLAKIVNCTKNKELAEPCNSCDQCKSVDSGSNLDVLEIDAASHRGIDDIRALRDAVKLSPISAKKKVYIIDEAHMLTTEASNALLKTLEEPPRHVMFILATTNPEKLIETIRSRCQIIHFKKASPEELERSLARIVKGENYKVDKEGLRLIAKYSEGSFRDGAKIVEQLISEGVKPNLADIKGFLEKKKVLEADALLTLIKDKKLKETLTHIEDMANSGVIIAEVVSSLLASLHKLLLAQSGVGETEEVVESKSLLTLIDLLQQAKANTPQSAVEQLPLEIAVIKWCRIDESESVKEEIAEDENAQESIEKTKKNSSPVFGNPNSAVVTSEMWNEILMKVKPLNTSVEALLRAAKPVEFDGKTLTLGVYYRFHKERLEESKNKLILERVIQEIFHKPTKIVCILTEPVAVIHQTKDAVLEDIKDADIVNVAKKIFES